MLFGNPERTSPRLSPDGKRLAWIAPDQKNVLQVWVKTIGQDDDKIVTADKKRGIRISGEACPHHFTLTDAAVAGSEKFWSQDGAGIFGMDAGKHHITSLLLHLASTVLLFLVLAGMTETLWR